MDEIRHRVDRLEDRVESHDRAIAELRAEARTRGEVLEEVRDTVQRIADREAREFAAAQAYRDRVLGLADRALGGLLGGLGVYLGSRLGQLAMLVLALAVAASALGGLYEVTYGDLRVVPVDSP